MAEPVFVTLGPNPPARLDKALARDVPEGAHLSRSRLARLIADGAVAGPAGVVTDQKAKVSEGEVYAIDVPDVAEVDTAPENIPLAVVFEDDDLIVVNKPAGMVVHPAPGTPSGTLVNALLHHCGDDLSGVGGQKRPGIVHRIDKDTSGLLVAAKSDAAHHGLAAQFEAHSVDRVYRAITHGVPSVADPRLMGLAGVAADPGGVIRITTDLARHKTDRQKQAVVKSGGRRAVTRAKVIEDFGVAALVEYRLETGRTHQIRVHAAYIGHGLIGDPVYGGRRTLGRAAGEAAQAGASGFHRQALHAARLGFSHPLTEALLTFDAPDPDDFHTLLQALRAAS
ncbi:MAG: RluA family pseudouridine synthase [Pseudomonadota bacterium]